MSLRNLLKMRGTLLTFEEKMEDGLVKQDWYPVPGGNDVRCFLDLNFIRSGKDPVWTPDSGFAQNRSGVLFLAPFAPAKPGHRIQMSKGPSGTFEIKSAMDEAWGPRKFHHLECFVQEVARVYVAEQGF